MRGLKVLSFRSFWCFFLLLTFYSASLFPSMDIIRDRIDLVQKLAQSVERQLQRQLDQHVLGPMGLNASVGQFALAVGVSTAVAYSVARYIVYNLYFHPTSKIPGPPVDRWIPFGGNMREIFRDEVQ